MRGVGVERTMIGTDGIISTFAGKHTTGPQDGDHSDWIELHNPTNAPVALCAWNRSFQESALQILRTVSMVAAGLATAAAALSISGV